MLIRRLLNKKIIIITAVIILLTTASFAAGYLYGNYHNRAPIIIQTCN